MYWNVNTWVDKNINHEKEERQYQYERLGLFQPSTYHSKMLSTYWVSDPMLDMRSMVVG